MPNATAKISGGVTFDVDEIEAYAKTIKNGRPAITTKDRKALMAAYSAMVKAMHNVGLYEEYIGVLSGMAERFAKI